MFVVDIAGTREADAALAALKRAREPFVILHPTRSISADRVWPTQRLGELGKALGERLGVRVLISGSEGDRAIAEEVARVAGGVSLAGKISLRAFAATAQRARCVVAMDSGPMHIAAVGAPTVGIFAMQCDEPGSLGSVGAVYGGNYLRASYLCPAGASERDLPGFCLREGVGVDVVFEGVDESLCR